MHSNTWGWEQEQKQDQDKVSDIYEYVYVCEEGIMSMHLISVCLEMLSS